jgi:hypothetical protein
MPRTDICLTFENGDQVFVNAELADAIVGVDYDGDVIARSEFGMLYPLTPCCHASGKGAMDDETYEAFVECRSCYSEVDDKYGAVYEEKDIIARPVEN